MANHPIFAGKSPDPSYELISGQIIFSWSSVVYIHFHGGLPSFNEDSFDGTIAESDFDETDDMVSVYCISCRRISRIYQTMRLIDW